MTIRWAHLVLLAGSVSTLAGCNHCGRKNCCATPPPPLRGGPLPPAATFTAPPAQPVFPGAAQPPPATFPANPPPGNVGNVRYYGTPPQTPPTTPPPQAPVEAPRSDVRLSPPEVPVPAPNVTENRASPSLPVGIPQFNQALPRVAAGLKPDAEGFDWLRANSYQTVLHVRAFDYDDSAEQREAEKRGLKFISMLAAATPTREQMDAFNRILDDTKAQPLFVYDRDGSLAGGLWYQYFRQVQGLSEEEARTRAMRLGWK